MNAKRFILFDFDGVIVDSFAIAAALAKRVCAINDPDRFRSYFEGNIYREAFSDFSKHEHGPDCDLTLDWWHEYQKSGAHEARSFPGVIDAVKAVAPRYQLAIISSGHGERFIQPALQHHGLTSYFPDVLGVEVHPSKVEKMRMLFTKYDISAPRCVFITDTLGDMREAAQLSVATIGVSWGFHAPETLQKGNPFRIVDSPAELPTAIDAYFAR